MARYTDSEKKTLLEIPIVQVMSHEGACLKHTNSHLYYSPFRDERTPSFHINHKNNTWYDFGISKGGGVLELVCILKNLTKADAFDYLAGISNITFFEEEFERIKKSQQRNSIRIDKVSDVFRNNTLVKFAQNRGIHRDVLEAHCKEVLYSVSSITYKQFYAIGFPTDCGGWVLRTSRFKRCTNSYITTINTIGVIAGKPISDSVVVFEGFMDYLSWIIYGGDRAYHDICVLNSVSNLGSALKWLSGHNRIESFLDNDKAGREALDVLKSYLINYAPKVCLSDRSSIYDGFKDLNEKLMADIKEGNQLTLNTD